MIVRVVRFKRTEESEYEKGLLFESSQMLLDADEEVVEQRHSIIDDITVIDFTPMLK